MHSIWTRSTFQPQTNVLNDPHTFPLQNRSATDSSICVTNCDAKLYQRFYACIKDDDLVRFFTNQTPKSLCEFR